MKTSATLRHPILRIVLRITLVIVSLGRLPIAAQTHTAASGALLADAPASAFAAYISNEHGVRYELVNAEYRPAAYGPDVLLRSVRLQADGRYAVRVIAADGSLRMTGFFHDADLSIGEGEFDYYHFDGSLESRGEFHHGLKTGAWERYLLDGRRLPDRLYAVLGYEALQVSMGEATKAGDLAPTLR